MGSEIQINSNPLLGPYILCSRGIAESDRLCSSNFTESDRLCSSNFTESDRLCSSNFTESDRLLFNISFFDIPTPMEIDFEIKTKSRNNTNHYIISHSFMELFGSIINGPNGYLHTIHLYDPFAQISLKIGHQISFNLIGGYQFLQKLNELGAQKIILSDIDFVSQPLGNSSILIQSHGNILINQSYAKFNMSIVLKKTGISFIISQQILNIHS